MRDDTPVPFVSVEDITDPANQKPGHGTFFGHNGETQGLNFWCPCGCGSLLGVSFRPNGWTWNKNKAKPTVQPSIKRINGCGWHGYLTAGEFAAC